jgi:thiol-disulfide isomerase/thioredoxin
MPKTAALLIKFLLPPLLLAGVVAALGTSGHCRVCAAIVDAVVGRSAVAATAAPADAPLVKSDRGDAGPVELGPIHQLVLRDLDGQEVDLARFAGRPIVIEVWATWCGPCRTLRRTLTEIAPQLTEHAALLAVSVDQQGPEAVKRYLGRERGDSGSEASSPFVELMVSPGFRAAIAPHDPGPTIPKLVYVDPRGRVAGIELGVSDARWILSRARALQ